MNTIRVEPCLNPNATQETSTAIPPAFCACDLGWPRGKRRCSRSRMPSVILQVQLPSELTLSASMLAAVTGRTQTAKQIAWLREREWIFEMDAQGNILVGCLYAHLKLAGMDLTAAQMPEVAHGFDLAAIR